ncbi:Wadjet anti-phage system protein JetD domain-containing protein [Nesterenkonia muleiensis]|uniref:Wadjet anti-phage system protein JetD domain-containing protein n=1 Tax=Nesterenkonia muleiensis TaxID=2282648 RepID=UPI000E72FB8E|nr:Wadjet anti-phage system protein JetD domain-containing protein [Nesterenkonia muleiensis]
MVTPEDAAERIGRLYERKHPEWAVAGAAEPVVDIPLHPPTQEQVLAETTSAADWIAAWRRAERGLGDGGRVIWETRQWASAGSQRMPVRLVLAEPYDAAGFIRRKGHWQAAESRTAELAGLLGVHGAAPGSALVETVQEALRRRVKRIADLDQAEYLRVREALVWLLQNPQPGIYPRQMPIRGVDSKWLERHSALVEPLYASASGRPSLGLLTPPGLMRLRFLDPALAPGGITDLSSPPQELDRLAEQMWELRAVLVVENLQTLLALPRWDGVVAIHNSGYAVKALASIDWLHQAQILYWGDLDVDGFQMLSMIRQRLPQTTSALMDRATLKAHLDLAGPDRKDAPRAIPEHLTGAERDGFAALADHGGIRLEQERIPWEYALERLNQALPGEAGLS